jgi:D-beta-D-heptose 7-phosphate kinase / D-beta-D-heptose 1-phosphate adenosyltransferase
MSILKNPTGFNAEERVMPLGPTEKASPQSTLWGILSEAELKQAVAQARRQGERIIMTNGCFDILHAGHVHYLAQARQLGDKLIVAVNSDASIQQLKGESRPINPLAQRLQVLAALQAVDWVVSFTEETPERLITELLPDVLVKGGDYHPDAIAGAAAVQKAGGTLQILDLIPGCSTSAIIRKICPGKH